VPFFDFSQKGAAVDGDDGCRLSIAPTTALSIGNRPFLATTLSFLSLGADAEGSAVHLTSGRSKSK
jgi:hypothetical protein